MNLSSIYGYFNVYDRNIIIYAITIYKAKETRGIRTKYNKAPAHNMIWLLDAFTVRKALCQELKSYSSVERDKNPHIRIRIKRINYIIKLIDSIL